MTLPNLSRRRLLRCAAAVPFVVGQAVPFAPWLAPVAGALAAEPNRKRSLILLWMDGGPATIDLWDLKSGHANGGPFKEIATKAPGLKISEHLPRLATWGDHLAIVRSMTSKEGDHGRGSHLMRAGYVPQGAIRFPAFGAVAAHELTHPEAELPPYVTIGPLRGNGNALGGGYLGPNRNPLALGADGAFAGGVEQALKVPHLVPAELPPGTDRLARQSLLARLDARFLGEHPDPAATSRAAAARAAERLQRPSVAAGFDLAGEPAELRDRYGRNLFGQGLLLARRLVERGVPCVEVALGGWDTHGDNFNQVAELSATLDRAWATLLDDLRGRGLLESTLIVCMGEFGRTPKINGGGGRDHWPQAFSTVLAGAGIRGGTVLGRTSADGTTVEDRPVKAPDLLATICTALGIDPAKQHLSNVGRPIRTVDPLGKPVTEVLS